MNDQTADREGLAEVLGAHNDPPGWMWSDSDQMVYSCECGDHYVAGAIDVIQERDVLAAAAWHEDHLAAALLASPEFARIIAEAEARAWDEGHERVCGIPARLCGIHGNPYRAALVAPDAEGEG